MLWNAEGRVSKCMCDCTLQRRCNSGWSTRQSVNVWPGLLFGGPGIQRMHDSPYLTSYEFNACQAGCIRAAHECQQHIRKSLPKNFGQQSMSTGGGVQLCLPDRLCSVPVGVFLFRFPAALSLSDCFPTTTSLCNTPVFTSNTQVSCLPSVCAPLCDLIHATW